MVERVALASTDASSVGTVPLSVTTLRDDTWPPALGRYNNLVNRLPGVEKRTRNPDRRWSDDGWEDEVKAHIRGLPYYT